METLMIHVLLVLATLTAAVGQVPPTPSGLPSADATARELGAPRDPFDTAEFFTRGNEAFSRGDFGAARREFARAASLADRDPAPHQAIGETYEAEGRYAEAVGSYRNALRRDSRFSLSQRSLVRLDDRREQMRAGLGAHGDIGPRDDPFSSRSGHTRFGYGSGSARAEAFGEPGFDEVSRTDPARAFDRLRGDLGWGSADGPVVNRKVAVDRNVARDRDVARERRRAFGMSDITEAIDPVDYDLPLSVGEDPTPDRLTRRETRVSGDEVRLSTAEARVGTREVRVGTAEARVEPEEVRASLSETRMSTAEARRDPLLREDDPLLHESDWQRGEEARRAGRVDEAIGAYQSLARRYPDNPLLERTLAHSLAGRYWLSRRSSDLTEAVRLLDRVLARDPAALPLDYALGLAYVESGRFDRAHRAATRLSRRPDTQVYADLLNALNPQTPKRGGR